MLQKKRFLWLIALFFLYQLSLPAHAAPTSHTVVLEGGVVGPGEEISYTTVSPKFAGRELPPGMYAGDLTVEITGQIVVEAGGTLSIGTLSINSLDESSPVLRGTLSQEPLIVVKPGGTLRLTTVTLDMAGGAFCWTRMGRNCSLCSL